MTDEITVNCQDDLLEARCKHMLNILVRVLET